MQTIISRLESSLNEERNAAEALLAVLQKEQDVLVSADVSDLPNLTDEKARIASRMSSLANDRYNLVAEAGYEASEHGMEAWTKSGDATDAVRDAWNALLAVARDGKERNRVNGLLIQQYMARNQNALNVLLSHAQAGNVYGPNGQSSTSKIGGRHLGAC
jgi:flagella synthesis protein FlgN